MPPSAIGIHRLVAVALCLGACAAAPPEPSTTIEMRLLPGQAPVADVEGPYAAYSRIGHGVVLRVWPDSIDESGVDLALIVRNTDEQEIRLQTIDLKASGETGPLSISGEADMLARFDAEPARRARPLPMSPAMNALGGSLESSTDGAVKLEAPGSSYSVASDRQAPEDPSSGDDRDARRRQIANWYLGELSIGPGATGFAGFRLALPDAAQTILLTADVAGEVHEFALLVGTQP